MKIEVGKIYLTRDGRKARVICIDRKNNERPVITLVDDFDKELIYTYTSTGKYYDEEEESEYDLVEEYSIWKDIKVDTPVYVKHLPKDTWKKRYFAKYENSTIYAWFDGTTSWTANSSVSYTEWKYAKLAREHDKPCS